MVLPDERKEVKAMSHKTTVMAVVNQKGGTGYGKLHIMKSLK